jgi:hypothetical protein
VPSAAVARAPTQIRAQAPWLVQTSEHFDIYHASLPAERVSEVVLEAEVAYAQLSGAFKYDLPRRVPIILLQRDSDLAAAADNARGLGLPAGALLGQRIVLSLQSLDRGIGLVVHELSHQFAFEIMPGTSRVAPFVIEGLAEYQRGVWAPQDLRLTRDAAATGAIPSVAVFATTDRHWAHAVFEFVAAQYGDEGIRRLVFALRAHETLAPAVQMAFGLPVEEFDQALRSYVTARFARP